VFLILPSLKAERIQSVKVGVFSGFALSAIALLILFFNNFLLVTNFSLFTPLQITYPQDLLFSLATAWTSGFLFGVTYRYIIRDDSNPHLKDGAVLAFTIVRSLALIEGAVKLTNNFAYLMILALESFICFTFARFAIDSAFNRQLLQRFND
jgi:hypothetical protein